MIRNQSLLVVLCGCNIQSLPSFPSCPNSDPGSYTCLPHAVVVNLAAFFELWDAFAFHWVKSTQVALSDDDMHDVSGLFIVNLWKLRETRQCAEHYF